DGFLDADQPAAVFGDGHARADDLALAGFAAELGCELENLPEPRGADRMPLRFESAGGIDRYASADGRVPALRDQAAFAGVTKAQVLGLDDFAHGGRVVHF